MSTRFRVIGHSPFGSFTTRNKWGEREIKRAFFYEHPQFSLASVVAIAEVTYF